MEKAPSLDQWISGVPGSMILIKPYNSEARDLVNTYMVNELTAEVNNI